ncbi:MAG TPA: DUF4350 domain-containing protein [Burkholderiales bacterium]|nr:DUF4350 domain-containing protein [Burkholderiales bacterium]
MRGWLLPFLLLALLATGVAWFLSTHERVPSREWVGPSAEARRNLYLAAERFASRMGLAVRELRSLPDLDTLKPKSVLLLPNRRQALDPRRVREIVAWVESGGHLIVEAELVGVPDPLLDLVGVERQRGAAPTKPVPVTLANGRKLAVSLFGAMTLEAADADEKGRFVSFDYGDGAVSALVGLHFARNQLIGTEDNADFFWHLAGTTPATELQIYLRPERLSLWAFLAQYAAPVLAAVAALIALWLWRVAPRFGPVRPDPAPARRRLLDHLRASGRFYWAQGLRGPLMAAARDAALRRIARTQPDFAQATQAERIARIAALARIPPEEVQRFMSAGANLRGAEFIRAMHTAQRIHAALEKANYGK